MPDAIRGRLPVDPDPPWVIGGFSDGGACAIQMATNHPSGYPNFVDISGQLEPTLGSRQLTANSLFGGDPAWFTAINPIDLPGREELPGPFGVVHRPLSRDTVGGP